jgi:hypothetical protein
MVPDQCVEGGLGGVSQLHFLEAGNNPFFTNSHTTLRSAAPLWMKGEES